MTAPDLSVIIVSWNVRDLLRACLASLVAGAGPSLSLEAIVVDNASADGSAAMVAAEFPAVQLIANQENRGFTGGNNQGLALARGRYVLFLNPDTVVLPGALAIMVAYLEAHPDVAALGPQLRYGDGRPQSSARRFPTLATALCESTPLEWHWPNNRWARAYRMEEGRQKMEDGGEATGDLPSSIFNLPFSVDWVVGAALLARREALDQVGGFDEGYFMYSEELDWCRRAALAGWRTVYLPAAEIVHYEGKSSEQAVAARHIRFHRSRVRYFRKFHGRAAAETVRLAVLGMFAVEWLLEAGKWLLGSRRPLRRARLAAYGCLLASGLR
ncbi:MAG: N-acetylglucosaminyl-diphospho-decaprenol L-rhamnosyltransferase [Chloroflexi bacterium ADurb.Bin325]|nr:MAG: N-acetylglucosaminyl-diphospho-decaprenol L-rhamnosyltransferase [Chloroflexi bacterium ADurb.Bin325]